MIIIFEGPDGTGKTTLSKMLAEELHAVYYAFPGQEPGSLGAHIYALHHGLFGDMEICPESKQLLHITAHINALQTRILYWLKEGRTVVLDRFYWSTYVYGLNYGARASFLKEIIKLEQDYWSPWLEHALLFYMRRAKPFSKDDDPASLQRWEGLLATYDWHFQTADPDLIPNRFIIGNEGPIEKAFDEILSLTRRTMSYEKSA